MALAPYSVLLTSARDLIIIQEFPKDTILSENRRSMTPFLRLEVSLTAKPRLGMGLRSKASNTGPSTSNCHIL